MTVSLQALLWMLLFYVPPAAVLWWLSRKKESYKKAAKEPFREQPLRMAGESSATRAAELYESAGTDIAVLLIACPLAGLLLSLVPTSARLIVFLFGFAGACLLALKLGQRLRRTLADMWCYRLGAKGEQIVGRELDRLMAQGYSVFHDVHFAGWNIDHVVVGPRGVFAIETKSWRKPTDTTAEIFLDGDTLILPGGKRDAKAHEQATRNASSLSTWIVEAAAENVNVVPVVALPGWKLSIKRYGDVAVY